MGKRTRSPSRKRRSPHNETAWYKLLKHHMLMFGGVCRLCGRWYAHVSEDPRGLRLAHLIPYSVTKEVARQDNVTLACQRCDDRMGVGIWNGIAPTIADEPSSLWVPFVPPFTY